MKLRLKIIWRPPSIRELTPNTFSTKLTHLDSEVSIYNHLHLINNIKHISDKKSGLH